MAETHDENAQVPDETERSTAAGPEAGPAGGEVSPATGEAPMAASREEELADSEVPAPTHEDELEAAGVPAGGGEGEPGVGGAAAAPEKLLLAKEVVAGLLKRLGIDADVEVRDSAEAITCSLRIRAGGDLFATGPRGQVLEAAGYLVNKMVNRDAEGRKWVSLELGGGTTEAAPDPAVERMAIRLGEAAKRMGQTLTVVPMGSKDRRRVHVALAGVEGVQTRSEGDGLFRRLLVEPKR